MLDFFSPDYVTARARFCDAAAAARWTVDGVAVDARGPGGEPLSIDAALSSPSSDRLVLVTCGLHGVEGFFGSAVLLALLDRWRRAPPAVPVALVHALNPYGFAWLRRTDADNVDLNRNFLDELSEFRGAPPGFDALSPILNPQRGRIARVPLALRLLPAVAKRGVRSVRHAIAVGQYEAPRGLFFGGHEPTRARRAVEGALRMSIAGARDVVHLDLHTGLGKKGEWKLLLDYTPGEGHERRLRAWFGPSSYEAPSSAGIAYTARGGLGAWCARHAGDRRYLFAYAEFGTASGLEVLDALRAENHAHHWRRPSDAATIHAKDRLRDVFCPPDPQWRSRALSDAVQLVDAAVQGLAAESGPTMR